MFRRIVTGLALTLSVTPAALAQTAPDLVEGRLDVQWGMRRTTTGAPIVRYHVFDERTRRNVEVKIDDAVARSYGGTLALSGKRVSLNVDAATALAPRVSAIRSVSADLGGRRVPDLGWSPSDDAHAGHGAMSSTIPMGPANAVMSGSRKYVVLNCRFSDIATQPNTAAAVNTAFFGTASNTMSSYWKETSANTVNFDGSVVIDWVALPQPRSYYISAAGDPNLGLLANDCAKAADSQVNFTQFDGILTQYNGSLGCCGWGGGMTLNLDGQTKSYAFTWWPPLNLPSLGFVAHEVGHSLGLPHSGGPYGRTYDSDWDVMSNSGAYYDPTMGTNYGAQTIAYHKQLLGWIPTARVFTAVEGSSTITIERHALPGANSNYLAALVPIPGTRNFFTVESRLRAGYDSKIAFEGVVIHEVQPATSDSRQEPAWVVDPDGNGKSADAGATWTVGETFYDRKSGISVTVDAQVGNAFTVTIRNSRAAGMMFGVSGKKTVVDAASAAADDEVALNVVGGGADATAWTATTLGRRGGWLRLTTASGTGSGTVRVRRDPTGLGPGTYVDTIRAVATNAAPAVYVDTLVVTAPTTLFLGLSLRSRSDSTLSVYSMSDSAALQIVGPNAATAAWTVTKKRSTTTLLTAAGGTLTSGTGPGMLRWRRYAPNTVGLIVDTITVTLTSNPAIKAVVIDSFRTVEPVKYTITARTQRGSMPEGSFPVRDSVNISFNGRWATGAKWDAYAYYWMANRFIRTDATDPTVSYATSGIGNGKLVWSRGAPALAPGTYIDTIRVQGPWYYAPNTTLGHEGTQYIVDTLVVVSAPLSLSLSATARRDTIRYGMAGSSDSVLVKLTGTGSSALEWSVVSKRSRSTLITEGAFVPVGKGKGSAWVRWARNVASLAPGLYIDTLLVSTISPAMSAFVIDSVVVRPGIALAAGRPSKRDSVVVGSTAPKSDSVSVIVLGTGGPTTAWTATSKNKPWLTLTTASGTGAGLVRWARNPASLAAGTYVDTITISATGIADGVTTVVDSFVVRAATGVVMAAYMTPDSIGGASRSTVVGDLTLDMTTAGVSLGSYAATVSWDSLVVRVDSVRAVPGGFAAPSVGPIGATSTSVSASAAGRAGVVPLARFYFRIVNDSAGRTSPISLNFTSVTASGSSTNLVSGVVLKASKAVTSGVLRGDLSLDGQITAADAQAVLQAVVGLPLPAGYKSAPHGDVNCDGKVGALDALIILSKVVGLPTGQFCVGIIR